MRKQKGHIVKISGRWYSSLTRRIIEQTASLRFHDLQLKHLKASPSCVGKV